jgi:hypothetical protein
MDRELDQRIRPFLAFHLVPWQPKLLKLRIQNVGAGPAFAIKGMVEAVTKEGTEAFDWSYPLLAPGKYEEFGVPSRPETTAQERFGLDQIREHVESIRARFTYAAANGRGYALDELISIKDITDDWIQSRMMATQDHPERLLPRIAKALDDLVEAVKRLGSGGP